MEIHNQNHISKQYISRLHTNFILIDHGLCPDWSRKTHRRRRDSIYLILDGQGQITINGTVLYPKKNNMVLLPRGSMVSLYSENETCYNKYWCDFTMDIDGRSVFDIINFPYMIELEDITHAKELLDKLDKLRLSQTASSAFLIQATLVELVSLFLEYNIENADLKEHDSFRDKINSYINQHISESLSIKQLADEMCYNEKYFIEVFKHHFLTTPAKYIKSLKLEKAKHELLYTDNKIAYIAGQLGYTSLQKFTKDFKNFSKYSPTDFRKVFK